MAQTADLPDDFVFSSVQLTTGTSNTIQLTGGSNLNLGSEQDGAIVLAREQL